MKDSSGDVGTESVTGTDVHKNDLGVREDVGRPLSAALVYKK